MTFAEIAAELDVDERTARRVVDDVLAKLQAAFGGTEHRPELVVRAIALVLSEKNSSTETPTIRRPRRRFSEKP